MFQLIDSAGEVVARVDKPRYIRQKPNGVFVRCDEDDAEAIAVHGRRYSIWGRAPLPETDTVTIVEIDGAEVLSGIERITEANSGSVANLIDAAFDLDVDREFIIDALFELDKRLEVIENGYALRKGNSKRREKILASDTALQSTSAGDS